MNFKADHWALLDLQYEYLDDGFKLTATTDVPCHLFCRMTKTPPRKHVLPAFRRGIYLQGDIRFCFVVYEDNEQEEAGDTLTHTFLKPGWPICETRWFYFVGSQNGTTSVSETAIFKFHFPAPPPEPPPPMTRLFLAQSNNRTLWYSHGTWAVARNTGDGNIGPWHNSPTYYIVSGDFLTASFFIYRGVLAFDTSPMSDTSIIQSANLHIFVNYIDTTTPGRPWLYLVRGVQDLPPVSTNYGDQNSQLTILGQVKILDLTLNSYNPIPLNADGISLINPAGLTLLGFRGQNDLEDFASLPLYRNYIAFHSQQKGIGYRPYLEVNYYPA